MNAHAWAELLTNPRRALELADEAGRLAAADGYAVGQAASLRTRGVCLFKRGQLDEAARDLNAALDAFRALGNDAGEAAVLGWLGHLRSRTGDVTGALRLRSQALRLRTQALRLARTARDRAEEADTLLTMGLDYHQPGDYAGALRCGEEAREISEEVGDARVDARLHSLGNARDLLGEHDRALEHFRLRLEFLQAGRGRDVGPTRSNIGSTYTALGRPKMALEGFSRAMDHIRKAQDRHAETAALTNLAEVRHTLGQHAAALELFETALAAARRLGHPHVQATIFLHLGNALAAQGERSRALRHLEDAVRIGGEVHARQLVVDASRSLARTHEADGNVAEAFRWYKAYHERESEIAGQQADQKIQAVLVREEVEKARQEAELLRRRNEELERHAREDALTGVYNRRHLNAELPARLERARRQGLELTVAMADVDRFKEVNDRFSHAVGDQVLRRVATLLRTGVRPGDVVARYGGEEFALVLAETPLEEAAALCESLRVAVQAYAWHEIHPELRVTLSLGLASTRGTGPAEGLLAAADARLYAAKRAGRNRVCW